jgi:C-terminal processing protease CtpA/Prc
MPQRPRLAVILISAFAACASTAGLSQQTYQFSKIDRDTAQQMLKSTIDDIRKNYYDPKFHGVDLDKQYNDASKYIATATTMNKSLASIAMAVESLDDSHTFFLPPQHATEREYGWRYDMIGDLCFITQVEPKSDADLKRVKPGDRILAINGIAPERDIIWQMQYMFNVLKPQPSMTLDLRDPQGHERTVDVAVQYGATQRVYDVTGADGASDYWKIVRDEQTSEHLERVRYAEYGDALLIAKLPEFNLSPTEVFDLLDKARKHDALILDLRGNPGGAIETLQYLLGGFFDKEIKIGQRVGRKDSKPVTTKGTGTPLTGKPFTGKLVVLVDSRSASCSELFARVIQLQKRGIVVGDRSSGSVMEAKRYSERSGSDVITLFGVQITEADLIMEDGKSLEHVGVTPDVMVLPTGGDLAAGRDPAMVRAAALVGQKIGQEEAGKLFPFEWPPLD